MEFGVENKGLSGRWQSDPTCPVVMHTRLYLAFFVTLICYTFAVVNYLIFAPHSGLASLQFIYSFIPYCPVMT